MNKGTETLKLIQSKAITLFYYINIVGDIL